MPVRADELCGPLAAHESQHPAVRKVHVVGPNAILQMASVLTADYGADGCRRIFERAGIQRYLALAPSEMVPEADARRLFQTVIDSIDPPAAQAVLRAAGYATGRYILAHRIPWPAKVALRFLPRALSAQLLLKAIGAHAWTFAGSGNVTLDLGRDLSIAIEGNPLATPGCPWHLGVFDALFGALVSKQVNFHHTACCAKGAEACRTRIVLVS